MLGGRRLKAPGEDGEGRPEEAQPRPVLMSTFREPGPSLAACVLGDREPGQPSQVSLPVAEPGRPLPAPTRCPG